MLSEDLATLVWVIAFVGLGVLGVVGWIWGRLRR